MPELPLIQLNLLAYMTTWQAWSLSIQKAQNSTQIKGIAFSELKAEKKQLVAEN